MGSESRGFCRLPKATTGRHFFRRGEPRAYHLHLAVQDGEFWSEHMMFRDALRADARLRDAYAALKMALAAKYPREREAYIEGKTAFVRAVLLEWRDARPRAAERN